MYDDPADIPAEDTARWHPFGNCYQLAFDDRIGWEADLAFAGETYESEFIRLHCLGINPLDEMDHKPCPVISQCGEWAASRRVLLPGVWGAMTTEERVYARRAAQRKTVGRTS